MKTFSSHKKASEAFVNQNYESGKASNLFFEGKKIYSYGHHFLIAEFVQNSDKKECIFFTKKGYSNSTAKHKNHVLSALYNAMKKPIFFVDSFNDLLANVESEKNEINDLKDKVTRARTRKDFLLNCIEEKQAALNEYIEFFQLPLMKQKIGV
jgi:hypothetical protein